VAIVIRGAVALVVGPILGGPTSWFALYLGPALVVFGAVAGLGVGTVGL